MSLHQEQQIYNLEQKVYKLLDRVGKLESEVRALKSKLPDHRTVNMVREDEGLPPLETTK